MANSLDGLVSGPHLPSDEQVMAYLRRNPDFLRRYPEILPELMPPSRYPEAEGVADLQAFMIERLQNEIDRVREAAEDVIQVSRVNMFLQSRTHEAALMLLAADDITALCRTVAEDLPELLAVDIGLIALEETPYCFPSVWPLPLHSVEAMLGEAPCLLESDILGDPVVFGRRAELVASHALAKLSPGPGCPRGLLALGTKAPHTFHPGQSTELLIFLARVTEICLHRMIA